MGVEGVGGGKDWVLLRGEGHAASEGALVTLTLVLTVARGRLSPESRKTWTCRRGAVGDDEEAAGVCLTSFSFVAEEEGSVGLGRVVQEGEPTGGEEVVVEVVEGRATLDRPTTLKLRLEREVLEGW